MTSLFLFEHAMEGFMRIVQVASEFAPFAKAGGLGEVVVGLSRELSRIGEQVDVIIPKYDFIKPLQHLKLEIPEFKSLENGRQIPNAMWSADAEGCHLHLLEVRHPSGYFHRPTIYGHDDDVPRFLYFCRAVAEYLKLKKQPIDILHLHDWHTGPLAILIRDLFSNDIQVKSIVLSIHNVEYQGKCASHDLSAIGLDGESYLTPLKLQDHNLKYPRTINLLKGSVVYADAIVPVSPTYAKEILTPPYGFHLDATLRKYKSKIHGILNGVDLNLWDPHTDPHLSTYYSATDTLSTIASAKQANKQTLINRFKLDKTASPWVGAITRLVSQKSPELLEQALYQTLELGGAFLLLGSSPNPAIQAHFEELKKKHLNNPRVLLHLEYDDALAHQLYAALDFLIVPSLFEPCGLTQMIALHYGTLPIVRATGGLKDTIVDCENPLAPSSHRNGFLFPHPTADSQKQALVRAVHLYRTNPATLQNLIRQGMQIDFSWQKPAQEYLKLYRKLIGQSTTSLSSSSLKRL